MVVAAMGRTLPPLVWTTGGGSTGGTGGVAGATGDAGASSCAHKHFILGFIVGSCSPGDLPPPVTGLVDYPGAGPRRPRTGPALSRNCAAPTLLCIPPPPPGTPS